MSFTDTANAKKYASISETAAAQAKLYADKLEQAPDYAGQAAASAAAAASSAQSVVNTEAAVNALAASASASATQAAASASEAGNAAAAAVSQCLRVPVGESISILPAADDRHDSLVQFDSSGQVSVLPKSGIAILDSGGKIPVSMIPAIALTEPFVVSSQAAMLALDAQVGDIAKRTDLGYSFCLASSPASTLSNWVQLTDDVLAQLGLPTGATQVGATDDSGNNTTVQGALALKASLAALAATNGYTLIPSMAPYLQIQAWKDEGDVRGWLAKCDGSTDDTVKVQQAINERQGIGPVIIPLPTVCSHLTVYSDTILQGRGREVSKLIMKAGSNNDFIVGGSSDNSTGAHRVRIESLWIYCADGSNTSGTGITIYGKETSFESIRVTGFPDNNIHTNWTATDTGISGMEGFFDDIIAEKSGMHNWLFEGPHDSNCSRIILIDASQKTEATYDGLSCRGVSGNARWTGVHAWTNYGNKRMRCALYCDRNAGGNEFELSHFEGAQLANVYILANNVTIGESCKVYYPWGGVNIRIAGSACRLYPTIMEEYKGIGLPLAKGIVFAGDYGGPSGCDINCMMLGQDAGSIDFGTSGGYNKIVVRGYNSSVGAVGYVGQPGATDEVDFLISGTNLSIVKKDQRMVNSPVFEATTAGSTQATANGISPISSTVYITTSPGALSGILIQNATAVGSGFEVTICNVNSSGHTIKVYPQPGHQFLGIGVDNPIQLAFGKAAQFRVVDANAGKWVILQGA